MIKLDTDTIIENNSLSNSKNESLEGPALIDFIKKDKTKVKLKIDADVALPNKFCEKEYKIEDVEKYIENLDTSESFSIKLTDLGNVFSGEYISKHYDTICNLLVNFMKLYTNENYENSQIEDILNYMSNFCIYVKIIAIEN